MALAAERFILQDLNKNAHEHVLLVHLTQATRQLKQFRECSHPLSDIESHVECLLDLCSRSGAPYIVHAAAKAIVGLSEYLSIDLLWKATRASNNREHVGTMFQIFRIILKLQKENTYNVKLFIKLFEENIHIISSLNITDLALGSLLRFLCSLVHVLKQQEQKCLAILRDVLPQLMESSLGEEQLSSIPRFIRYKATVLLYRLCMFDDIDVSYLLLALLSSRKDVLQLSTKVHTYDEVRVAPFITSCSEDNTDVQRRAILTLMKCVVTLNKGGTDNMRHLSEVILVEWLSQAGDNMEGLVTSLICLFTYEDDLLLGLLITLMDFSSSWFRSDVYDAFLSSISPVRVFHLFLSTIHYDHSVLIDFLISESSGTTFLQYLLRFLRLIKDNWLEFNNSETKKRKRHERMDEVSVQRAKECLINLEQSIQRLHNKHLFPYNVSTLLERFKVLHKAG